MGRGRGGSTGRVRRLPRLGVQVLGRPAEAIRTTEGSCGTGWPWRSVAVSRRPHFRLAGATLRSAVQPAVVVAARAMSVSREARRMPAGPAAALARRAARGRPAPTPSASRRGVAHRRVPTDAAPPARAWMESPPMPAALEAGAARHASLELKPACPRRANPSHAVRPTRKARAPPVRPV